MRALQKLGAFAATVIVGVAVAYPASGHDHGRHSTVSHVLLISVDRLRQSDLTWYVRTHPSSGLAQLTYGVSSTSVRAHRFPRTRSRAWSGR